MPFFSVFNATTSATSTITGATLGSWMTDTTSSATYTNCWVMINEANYTSSIFQQAVSGYQAECTAGMAEYQRQSNLAQQQLGAQEMPPALEGLVPRPRANPAIVEARDRAHKLLLRNLTPEQRKTFEDGKWFIVEGGRSKTRYRIRDIGHASGNIEVLHRGGDISHRLCGHCNSGEIPLWDQLLAQKFMLESAEDEFLALANRH